MYGIRGAGAKVEKKVEKKPSHARWKALMCGCAAVVTWSTVALCSASTGSANSRPTMSETPRELRP